MALDEVDQVEDALREVRVELAKAGIDTPFAHDGVGLLVAKLRKVERELADCEAVQALQDAASGLRQASQGIAVAIRALAEVTKSERASSYVEACRVISATNPAYMCGKLRGHTGPHDGD